MDPVESHDGSRSERAGKPPPDICYLSAKQMDDWKVQR
jgi:hypothetical protein